MDVERISHWLKKYDRFAAGACSCRVAERVRCDVDVCYALRTSQLFNTPNMSRSAYVAEVDGAKCVACAGCVEVCPAGAVQLGQKLPTAEGDVTYPRQLLPTLGWGEDDWGPDYKDNNRIECHETGTAPCKVACSAHISVQGYLRMAAQGRYRDALALIKKENPSSCHALIVPFFRDSPEGRRRSFPRSA